MKIILEKNKNKNFLQVNQWDKTLTKRACTQYWAYINARYNTWININEDFIEEWVIESQKSWLLGISSWGRLDKNNQYVWKRLWLNCLEFTKHDYLLEELLENEYMVGVGSATDIDFFIDAIDWKLDTKDFNKFKDGKIITRHRYNIIKNTLEWKYYIFNSYSNRNNNNSLNDDCNFVEFSSLEEMKKILYITCYCFI